jgi:hypothetical protein
MVLNRLFKRTIIQNHVEDLIRVLRTHVLLQGFSGTNRAIKREGQGKENPREKKRGISNVVIL